MNIALSDKSDFETHHLTANILALCSDKLILDEQYNNFLRRISLECNSLHK